MASISHQKLLHGTSSSQTNLRLRRRSNRFNEFEFNQLYNAEIDSEALASDEAKDVGGLRRTLPFKSPPPLLQLLLLMLLRCVRCLVENTILNSIRKYRKIENFSPEFVTKILFVRISEELKEC